MAFEAVLETALESACMVASSEDGIWNSTVDGIGVSSVVSIEDGIWNSIVDSIGAGILSQGFELDFGDGVRASIKTSIWARI